MTAQYWIAKYVEDVFRNEPTNIGVVVRLDGNLSAQFVGEREDGTCDGRRIRSRFSHPSVYMQWHDYWRTAISERRLEDLLASNTENFFVVAGGEVSDTGADSAAEVCRFLFSLLVSEGGVAEAYSWTADDVADAAEQGLSGEIADLFKQAEVLEDGHQLMIRHPIVRNAPIVGRHVVHKPSFTQKNGLLSVIEYIDLSRPKQKHVTERTGWMGYMFSDIKEADRSALAYSIIRPADGEVMDYANGILGSVSQVVNWLDTNQRNQFVEERRRIASAL